MFIIGASVTSATLCDGIIASDQASFLTPFQRLGIPPEGCSSVHFARVMRPEVARQMLFENLKVTAAQAKDAGFVIDVSILYYIICMQMPLIILT